MSIHSELVKNDSPPGGTVELLSGNRPRRRVGKVVLDYAVALVLFVLAFPLMCLLAALVRLTSRGPALYSQLRVGRGGGLFRIYKFRTMVDGCEKRSGAQWSLPGDSRITKVGRVLRASHLDELPQLINVLFGHMSLVGPRPERPEFTPGLSRVIPRYEDRHLVRPGVTGLAQVQLPPDSGLESVRRKLLYDLWYVEHGGLGLDLRLILCTAGKVIFLPMSLCCRLLRVPGAAVVEPSGGTVAVSVASPRRSDVTAFDMPAKTPEPEKRKSRLVQRASR